MKTKFWALLLSFLLFALPISQALAAEPSPVTNASGWFQPSTSVDAEFQSTYYGGGSVSVSTYAGKTLILLFGRSTCGNCSAALTFLSQNVSSLRKEDIEILVVYEDLLPGVANRDFDARVASNGWSNLRFACDAWHYGWQNLRNIGFGANTITLPLIFIIDPNGKIVACSTGNLSSAGRDALLRYARSGSPTATPMPTPTPGATATLALNTTTRTIAAGKTYRLRATVVSDSAVVESVTWRSGNTKIATVNSSGTVRGVRAGRASITATVCLSNGDVLTQRATIYVGRAVTGVRLNSTSQTLRVGRSFNLRATVAPRNAANNRVTWASSDETVATVSSSGRVRAVGPGRATITVTTECGRKTARCRITVR